MAKFVVVSVLDTAVAAFGRPWFAPTRQAAVRAFSDEVNRKVEGNHLSAHPEDFILHELGVFNDQTGMFETGQPEIIVRAADLLAK